jgi:hypothetical protein
MITTSSIPKSRLSKLPDAVLSLISMGQYTLYSVSLPSRPDVVYALRIGAKDIFLLTNDGEPVDYDSLEGLKIKEKIFLEDVHSPYVVHNFSLDFAATRS